MNVEHEERALGYEPESKKKTREENYIHEMCVDEWKKKKVNFSAFLAAI